MTDDSSFVQLLSPLRFALGTDLVTKCKMFLRQEYHGGRRSLAGSPKRFVRMIQRARPHFRPVRTMSRFGRKPYAQKKDMPKVSASVSVRPSAIPEARENIIGLVVWNQRMEGIASSPERVATLYDRALANPLTIPE